METLEAILTRTSVREYTSQSIPAEIVHELLVAAMQAPSAGNQQPWHFILMQDQESKNRLADLLPYGKMLKTAPLGVVVCGNRSLERHPGYWVQDCSAATQNLLLAAHAKGLGAVWIGVHPVEERVKSLQKELGLPETVLPLCAIALGYPSAKPNPPKSRFDESRLHTNRW